MNSNTSHSPSQYTITKTVAAQSSSETGKQIITTIRNDSSPAATTIIKKQVVRCVLIADIRTEKI